MARPLRPQFEGAIYHLTTRAVARTAIVRDDWDRIRFLGIFENVAERRGWEVHAWCLMTNHYHLILTTPEADIAAGMQELNGIYAQSFNRRYRREGHLFGARYKSVVVETEAHGLLVSRYVALNPVEAGLCSRPEQWRWSSYAATIGLRPAPSFLRPGWLLDQFAADAELARARYREFVEQGIPGAAAA